MKSTGDGLLVTFDAPSQAVACTVSLRDALAGIGVEIRAGVHAGEVELHDDGDVSGIAVNLAARVEQQAGDGEIWTSSTVRDMMLGGSTESRNWRHRHRFDLDVGAGLITVDLQEHIADARGLALLMGYDDLDFLHVTIIAARPPMPPGISPGAEHPLRRRPEAARAVSLPVLV